GFIEALQFFKTRPDKVVPILKKNLARRDGLEEDEYYVHLQCEWARPLSKKPYPLPGTIQNVYDLDVDKDPAMNDVGPMEPWDLHYLRGIDDSGFIYNFSVSEESSHRLYGHSIVGCRNGFSALWSRNKGGWCYGTQKLCFPKRRRDSAQVYLRRQ